MENSNMSTIEAFAETENVNVADARQAILRALKNGERFTQLSLIENVVSSTGVDIARVFVEAMDGLIAEGEIHSAKGRNGGLKLGPKPEKTAKSQAAALLTSMRKVS
jgi:hypothetical protein